MRTKLFLAVFMAMFFLSGCGLSPASPTPTASPLPATATASPTASPQPTSSPTATATLTPFPTATPIPLGAGGGGIAFQSERGGLPAVLVMEVNGQSVVPLTDRKSAGFQFSWSPDGRAIVFAENNAGGIFTVKADGSDKKRLVGGSDKYYAPLWSPDGQRIAFYSTEDGHWALHVVHVDGSKNVDLSGNTVFGGAASWSPDGTMIAYEALLNTMQAPDIYVVGLDGSDPVQLTFSSASDIEPAWSPDGQWIAFTSLRDDKAEIYVMRPDGSEQKRLTDSVGDNAQPVWSPDGKRIAFISWRDEPNLETCESRCNIEIYVMDADGGNLVRLTDHPAPDYHPAWSPDGKYLAFASQRDEPDLATCGEKCNSEIYIVPAPIGANAPAGEVVRLTDDPAADWHPQWQPSLTRELVVPTPKPTVTPRPTPMAQQVVEAVQRVTPGPDALNPQGPWMLLDIRDEDTAESGEFLVNLDAGGAWISCPRSWFVTEPDHYQWPDQRHYSPLGDYFVCLESVDPENEGREGVLVIRHLPGGQKVDSLPIYSSQLLQELDQAGSDPNWVTTYFTSEAYTTMMASGQALWSPNGRYLAYTSAADGPSTDVYVYDTVDQIKRRLTDGATQVTLLTWSPDSQWIIHTAWNKGERVGMDGRAIPAVQSIWAVRPDDTEVRLLDELAWESEEERLIAWSSPTSFVVGSVMYAHEIGTELSHLRSVDIDGSTATMLYEPVVESAAFDPRTQMLSYTSGVFAGEGEGLFIWHFGLQGPVQVDGRLWHRVRWLPELGLFVAEWFWPGDERMILFTPDGKISSLFPDETGSSPIPSPDGQWVAFVGENAFGQQGVRIYDRQGNWVRHILPKDSYAGSDGNVSLLVWMPDSSGFWLVQQLHSEPESTSIWSEYGRVIEYTLANDFATIFVEYLEGKFDFAAFGGFILRP